MMLHDSTTVTCYGGNNKRWRPHYNESCCSDSEDAHMPSLVITDMCRTTGDGSGSGDGDMVGNGRGVPLCLNSNEY